MLTAPALAFLDVGGQEMILILVVALLIFGGKLPEVARNLGRTMAEFRRSAQNLTREFRYDDPPRRPPPGVVRKWNAGPREPEGTGWASAPNAEDESPAQAQTENAARQPGAEPPAAQPPSNS